MLKLELTVLILLSRISRANQPNAILSSIVLPIRMYLKDCKLPTLLSIRNFILW